MKKILKITTSIVIVFFILLLIVIVAVNPDEVFVKRCYKNNDETFNSIASEFSKFYEPSLLSIRYDYSSNTIEKYYADKEISCDNDTDYLKNSLYELQKEYNDFSDYNVFSSINSFYDDSGNMLMYFTVKNTKLDKGSNKGRNEKIRHLYLVYIAESYQGHGSNLSIDKFGIITEPFSGNWYFYSADSPTG